MLIFRRLVRVLFEGASLSRCKVSVGCYLDSDTYTPLACLASLFACRGQCGRMPLCIMLPKVLRLVRVRAGLKRLVPSHSFRNPSQ